MPITSTRCLRISGRRSWALAGRVIGAMMSGLAALARETSVERSCGGSGHGMTSTISHESLAAAWAAWNPLALFWPKRSLQYISTTRLGDTFASWKTSVKYCTALRPNEEPVGKLRYTYWVFCCPSFTALATLAVIGSAAAMSTRKGIRRCWTTGTIDAVEPESKEPISIWAPWLITRSASVRPSSGLVWVSPRRSSSFIPLSDLMPPAALMASAAICAPRRQAWPGSASGPVIGCTAPTLSVGDWARSTVGKPSAAAPTAVPAAFKKVRRCTRGFRRSLIDIPRWIGVSSELAQELLGDDHSLDLIRALVDLGDLGVAHEALHRKLLRVAVAAEDLHRVGGRLHGGVRGQALGHRGLERGTGDAVVDQRGGVMDDEPRGVHRDRHVGQHELDALEGGDGPIKGAPLLRVRHRGVERGLGDADRLRADGGARLLERLHRGLEALPFRPEPVLHRDLAIAEVQRHRGRAMDAELALRLPHRETLQPWLDQERGHTLGPLAGVGGDEHGDDAGVRAVRHPHLGAVQHIAVALAHGPAGHRRRVRSRTGLGERERRGHLTAGELGQVAPLLLLAAREDDRIAPEVLEQEDGRTRGTGPGHLLGGQTEGQRARRGAPVGRRDVEPHQPLLAQQLELLVGVLAGLIRVGRERSDALARDLPREVPDGPLVVRQVVQIAHFE